MLLSINSSVKEAYKRLDSIPNVNLNEVMDGSYEGHAQEIDVVSVTVKVSIKDHMIQDIKLVEHNCGLGKKAKVLIPQMVQENTVEVDEIAGATLSSKTIQVAVKNALKKGEK